MFQTSIFNDVFLFYYEYAKICVWISCHFIVIWYICFPYYVILLVIINQQFIFLVLLLQIAIFPPWLLQSGQTKANRTWKALWSMKTKELHNCDNSLSDLCVQSGKWTGPFWNSIYLFLLFSSATELSMPGSVLSGQPCTLLLWTNNFRIDYL